jgi:hypothetical protein
MTTVTVEQEASLPPLPRLPPPPIEIPPHIAANICKMLERVTVTGMEAVAWVQAFQLLQQIAQQQQGPGVPFPGLGG